MNIDPALRNVVYLVAAALFIFGLKGLTHPRTAVRGNMLGATGMLLAVVVTLLDRNVVGWTGVVIGLGVGAAAGAVFALRVRMTAMPQMVALLNGFGGAASAAVAGAELHIKLHDADKLGLPFFEALAAIGKETPAQALVAITVAGLIGAVTFSGSVLAFAKLQELVPGSPIGHIGIKVANSALALVCIALGVMIFRDPHSVWAYWALIGVALLLGVGLVAPIGGADMPVVISLLNSYSGLAAAATGFAINNVALIITGSLVGASGLILTRIMCVAMNRSLTNVLFGMMAPAGAAADADDVYAGRVKSTTADEIAIILDGAQRVLVIPGYGLAVSQAQHAVRDLMKALEARGVRVDFAIHPVAGRMPGHMNVLLAEADIPYEKLLEMDAANSIMEQVDVSIVIGANDVVNPSARTDPKSPIAGMPIIDADRARTCVVIKRSLSPGFAGIPNPLFAADNCLMYFADGQKAVQGLIAAVKAL